MILSGLLLLHASGLRIVSECKYKCYFCNNKYSCYKFNRFSIIFAKPRRRRRSGGDIQSVEEQNPFPTAWNFGNKSLNLRNIQPNSHEKLSPCMDARFAAARHLLPNGRQRLRDTAGNGPAIHPRRGPRSLRAGPFANPRGGRRFISGREVKTGKNRAMFLWKN